MKLIKELEKVNQEVFYIYKNTIKIRKSIKKRLFHTIYKYLNDGSLKRRLTSYAGWLKYCNSKHLL